MKVGAETDARTKFEQVSFDNRLQEGVYGALCDMGSNLYPHIRAPLSASA